MGPYFASWKNSVSPVQEVLDISDSRAGHSCHEWQLTGWCDQQDGRVLSGSCHSQGESSTPLITINPGRSQPVISQMSHWAAKCGCQTWLVLESKGAFLFKPLSCHHVYQSPMQCDCWEEREEKYLKHEGETHINQNNPILLGWSQNNRYTMKIMIVKSIYFLHLLLH